MVASRVELKDRLLMELAFVLDAPRRALNETNDANPSTVRLALMQGQYTRELNEWVNASLRPFITIHGTEIPHFWNSVMEPCFMIRDILVSSDDVLRKRQRFDEAVASALAAIRAIPADDPDVMVPPKSSFNAYRRLRALCATSAACFHLFDPYLDARVFLLYLTDVPDGVEIKIITDETIMLPRNTDRKRVFQRDQIVSMSELFATDRPRSYHFLMTHSIHDRHLRTDDKVFQLGGSVAHASLKDFYSITETDSNPALQATLDGIIAAATPWYHPGMSRHRRWCALCGSVMDVRPSGACQACNSPL